MYSISPSIYVAFQSLLISDHDDHVESFYANSTLSFTSFQLRTDAEITAVDQIIEAYQSYLWTVMQPRDLTVSVIISNLLLQCSESLRTVYRDCEVKSITEIVENSYRERSNAIDSSIFYSTILLMTTLIETNWDKHHLILLCFYIWHMILAVL